MNDLMAYQKALSLDEDSTDIDNKDDVLPRVLAIYHDVLSISNFTADGNFFATSSDRLLSNQILFKLHRELRNCIDKFDWQPTLVNILNNPSPQSLVDLLQWQKTPD